MGKIFVLDFFRNFIFFTEGSCEHIMNETFVDHINNDREMG